MSDREPRSRRKRKAAQEKAALETPAQQKAPFQHRNSSDSEAEEDSLAHHGRSSTAKVAFIMVFTALAFALAAVVFSLYGTSGSGESESSVVYSQPEAFYVDDAVAQNEINEFLERSPDIEENYATSRGEPSAVTSSSKVPYESTDESHASAASTPEMQSSITEPVAVEWTTTDSAFTIDATVPVSEVPLYKEKQADTEKSGAEPFAEMPESLISSIEVEVGNEFSATSAPDLEASSSVEMSVQTSEATHLSVEEAAEASSIEATVSEFPPGDSHLSSSTVHAAKENEHPSTEERKSDTSGLDHSTEDQLREAEELLEKDPDEDSYWSL